MFRSVNAALRRIATDQIARMPLPGQASKASAGVIQRKGTCRLNKGAIENRDTNASVNHYNLLHAFFFVGGIFGILVCFPCYE